MQKSATQHLPYSLIGEILAIRIYFLCIVYGKYIAQANYLTQNHII